MIQRLATLRATAPLAVLLGALGLLASAETGAPANSGPDAKSATKPASDAAPKHKYTTETVRGRVVWIEEALAGEFGVTTEPSAAEKTVVLQTPEGRLWPIIPDVRGQAFAVDERLRNVDLELLVRRYAEAPMIQVIRVFRPSEKGLLEVDYWCDICAIPMYILKPCECCQGQTRLRERPAADSRDGG